MAARMVLFMIMISSVISSKILPSEVFTDEVETTAEDQIDVDTELINLLIELHENHEILKGLLRNNASVSNLYY